MLRPERLTSVNVDSSAGLRQINLWPLTPQVPLTDHRWVCPAPSVTTCQSTGFAPLARWLNEWSNEWSKHTNEWSARMFPHSSGHHSLSQACARPLVRSCARACARVLVRSCVSQTHQVVLLWFLSRLQRKPVLNDHSDVLKVQSLEVVFYQLWSGDWPDRRFLDLQDAPSHPGWFPGWLPVTQTGSQTGSQ